MDRIVDHTKFIADGAIVNWEEAWRKQASAAQQMNQRPPPEPKRQFDVQLRWQVSASAGVPPVPFTVWQRVDKDILEPVLLSQSADGVLVWSGEPLVTLDIECRPINRAEPTALYGYRQGSTVTAIVAVSEIVRGTGPFRLTIRAGSITFARLDNATLLSARATTANAVANKAQWKEVEFVGLPYDKAQWAGLDYEGQKQGLVSNLVQPFDAAVERLARAGAPLGWWPVTEMGHEAPAWDTPDGPGLVSEIQKMLLPVVGQLFQPGLPPKQQATQRAMVNADFNSGAGQPRTVTSSRMNVPVLGTLQVVSGTDPNVALATGFGTGYPLNADEARSATDYMVTATYPKGMDGLNPIELAWIIPRPTIHSSAAAAAGMTATRAGLVSPERRNRPWRETVAIDWQALPATSLLFPRISGASIARFDPMDNAPATCLLERHDSGGWRPLAPMSRPSPHADRIRLVDSQRLLPMDGTALSNEYTVACQDPFGLWSSWNDIEYSSVEPLPPVPVLGESSLVATWSGSPQCAAVLEATVTLDWSVRSPAFAQLKVSIFPSPYNGAPTPAGVDPLTTIAGGQNISILIQFNGDQPLTSTAGCTVAWISNKPDEGPFPIPPDPNNDIRRYRIVMTGLTLDYATTSDYGAAIWAREVAAGRPDWGAFTPTPHRAFASSPVPVLVPTFNLPVVPLGSLPDSEGCSHVDIRTSGLVGAASVVIWSASETRIRQAAGSGPIPQNNSLSERFVELKAAFTGLSNELKRSVFSRERELPAGPASVDHKLPRGSKEIYFFLATGRTATNIESPWPLSVGQLQAAAAPTLVAPAVPELSAAFNAAGDHIQLEMSVRSRVPVTAFEVHRTYKGPITASAAMMGPPIASVPALQGAEAANPQGLRYAATFTDPAFGDWRPAFYRVVAIPALVTVDLENGRIGRRSPDSSLTTLLLPPITPTDLTLVGTDEWGAPPNGVLIRIRTSARFEKFAAGSFTLSCEQQDKVFSSTLEAIPIASTTTAPTSVGSGTFTRTARSGGLAEIGIWFMRPNHQTQVTAKIHLTDPLGRSNEIAVVIAADPLVPMPVIAITGSKVVPPARVVTFTMNAPLGIDPAGTWMLDASARRIAGFSPAASVRMTVPAIPDASAVLPNSPGRLIIARQKNATDPGGPKVEYLARIRVARPFRLTLKLTDPLGRSTSVDQLIS